MVKRFIIRVKAGLIHLLGGVTKAESAFNAFEARGKARGDFEEMTCEVFSQVDLNKHQRKCYELTCKQLGQAVYPYAKHIYAENGVYTAVVQVLRSKK